MCKINYSNKHLKLAKKWGVGGGEGGRGGARQLILATLRMLQMIPIFSFLVGLFVFREGDDNIKYKSY